MKEFTEKDVEAFSSQEAKEWYFVPDDVFVGVPDEIANAMKDADKEQLKICYEDLASIRV